MEGILIPQTQVVVTHCLFANDIILFGEVSVREAKSIKKVLEEYCEVSSQKVNQAKSKVFFFHCSPLL